jgi:hypothetical protein
MDNGTGAGAPADGVPPAGQARGLLEEDEFDRMVLQVKGASVAGACMIAFTLFEVFGPGRPGLAGIPVLSRGILLGEILGYAIGAVLLLRLSRVGAYLLLLTCVVSIALSRVALAGAIPGIVVMFLAMLALRHTQRIHRLLAFARATAAAQPEPTGA